MSIWITSCILLILAISTLLAPSPLAIGSTILLIALGTSRFFALGSSSWLAFLIFLIYVSGILVIFSYFLALTPNHPSIFMGYYQLSVCSARLIILISYSYSDIWISESESQLPITEFIYLPSNCVILIFLTILLLITIIVVVKICQRSKGPMRAFISYVQTYTYYTPSN